MHFSDYLKAWLISWIPDLALSWGYMKLTDGQTSTFWWCLLVLLVLQVFLMIKTLIGGSLIFHLFVKERASSAIALDMQKTEFPMPEAGEDGEAFLFRIVEDETLPTNVRLRANGTLGALEAARHNGVFAGLRTSAILNLAAKKFSNGFT